MQAEQEITGFSISPTVERFAAAAGVAAMVAGGRFPRARIGIERPDEQHIEIDPQVATVARAPVSDRMISEESNQCRPFRQVDWVLESTL